MEDADERRKRLKILREEASLVTAGGVQGSPETAHMINPLAEPSFNSSAEPSSAQRFSFYSDPVGSLQGSRPQGANPRPAQAARGPSPSTSHQQRRGPPQPPHQHPQGPRPAFQGSYQGYPQNGAQFAPPSQGPGQFYGRPPPSQFSQQQSFFGGQAPYQSFPGGAPGNSQQQGYQPAPVYQQQVGGGAPPGFPPPTTLPGPSFMGGLQQQGRSFAQQPHQGRGRGSGGRGEGRSPGGRGGGRGGNMLLSSMLDNPWRELEERHAKQVQHAKLAQHASERQAEAAPKNTVAVPKGPISLADILAGALQDAEDGVASGEGAGDRPWH